MIRRPTISGEFTMQLTEQQYAALVEAIPALAPACCYPPEPTDPSDDWNDVYHAYGYHYCRVDQDWHRSPECAIEGKSVPPVHGPGLGDVVTE